MGNYQDLALATSFSLYATYSYKYSQNVSEWFNTPDDVFSQILTYFIAMSLLIMPIQIYRHICKVNSVETTSPNEDKLLPGFNMNMKDSNNKRNLDGLSVYLIIILMI